jgi:hypothetical protein
MADPKHLAQLRKGPGNRKGPGKWSTWRKGNPTAVEPLRRYKLAELDYLRTINEIKHGEDNDAIDLPAAIIESSDEGRAE